MRSLAIASLETAQEALNLYAPEQEKVDPLDIENTGAAEVWLKAWDSSYHDPIKLQGTWRFENDTEVDWPVRFMYSCILAIYGAGTPTPAVTPSPVPATFDTPTPSAPTKMDDVPGEFVHRTELRNVTGFAFLAIFIANILAYRFTFRSFRPAAILAFVLLMFEMLVAPILIRRILGKFGVAVIQTWINLIDLACGAMGLFLPLGGLGWIRRRGDMKNLAG